MNILIINCSPVKNGATAEIVSFVSTYTKINNDARCVRIDDFDIKFCKGCRQCHATTKCFQEDDTKKLIEQYVWADRIVSVSQLYWADIPYQFKVFIERFTSWCNTYEHDSTIPQGKVVM